MYIRNQVKFYILPVLICCLCLLLTGCGIETSPSASEENVPTQSRTEDTLPSTAPAVETTVPVPDAFVEQILSQYPKASCTEFISCIGADHYPYPDSISGYIEELTLDLDGDGTAERLMLLAEGSSVHLQVYVNNNGTYALSCQTAVTYLDYCSQQNISLFYSTEAEAYLLFVDECTSGAYTGIDAQTGRLYSVNVAEISLLCRTAADTFGMEKDDIEAKLLSFGVPYAQNCAAISGDTDNSQYRELLEIRHRVFQSDPMGGWYGREHHLQLLTPEQAAAPSDAVQTWTITVQSSQGFTENREETWIREFTAGSSYVLRPTWSDGRETGYAILSYQVDTQERTIEIFMDIPEGAVHWKGLVLDLENNTYYGLEYTVF